MTALPCEACGSLSARLMETRLAAGTLAKRRRYECQACHARCTTIEVQIGYCWRPGERQMRTTPEQMARLRGRVRRVFAR